MKFVLLDLYFSMLLFIKAHYNAVCQAVLWSLANSRLEMVAVMLPLQFLSKALLRSSLCSPSLEDSRTAKPYIR